VNSIHDPALAPKGRSAIFIQTGACAEFADNWGTKNGKRTKQYTLNSEGASAGWTFHPQKAMNSGLKFFTGFHPPVRNLFQVGLWAMSPGGAPSGAITGRIVSEIVKRRLAWGI
jgi:phytoene dehydrogenase-like protein